MTMSLIHFPDEPEFFLDELQKDSATEKSRPEHEQKDTAAPPPAPRRSTREVRHSDYYGVQLYTATELDKEPETVREVLNS